MKILFITIQIIIVTSLCSFAQSMLKYYIESDLEREKQIRNFVAEKKWAIWQQKIITNVLK